MKSSGSIKHVGGRKVARDQHGIGVQTRINAEGHSESESQREWLGGRAGQGRWDNYPSPDSSSSSRYGTVVMVALMI